jgi:AAHS family 4-hydroxybenzoate transporter-like MFS transporter
MLLWLVTFTTLLLGYFLVNWTPLILVDAGLDHHRAIMGVVTLNLGGIIGSLVLGRISDKRGPFLAIGAAFAVGALFVAIVGLMIQSSATVLLALIFVVGLCLFGAQLNIPALAANYYPLQMRSTGIGWSMGMGRLGSIVGPTVGGALVAFGLASGQLFLCAAVPAVVACITVAAMSFNVPTQEIDGGPESS